MKNITLLTFLSAIGEKALKIYEGMTFNPPESLKVLDSVVQKFEEFCIGQTNETFERYVFNSRSQKADESIDQYVLALLQERQLTLEKAINICKREKQLLGI